MLLEFDPGKDRQNQRKHGISLARFADMDEATWLSAQDTRREYGEVRWVFFGLIEECCTAPSSPSEATPTES